MCVLICLQMLMLLDGSWKLVYTSNSELLAILALSRLPFVSIGDITQRIDSATNTVENKAAISVPLSRTALSTTASFEVRSPKRLQVRFEKGAIQVSSRAGTAVRASPSGLVVLWVEQLASLGMRVTHRSGRVWQHSSTSCNQDVSPGAIGCGWGAGE